MKRDQDMSWDFPQGRAVHGLYTAPQPEGPVAVREYLLTDVEGQRCLMLRWVKEAVFPIDSMTFEVVQLDAVGAELGMVRVTHADSDIPPTETGKVFTPERGIVVDERCMDVQIHLVEVVSGAYVYRIRNHRVTVDYRAEEPWVYDEKAGKREGLSDRVSLRVRSKKAERVRFLWPAALITVLVIALMIVFPYLPKKGTGKETAHISREVMCFDLPVSDCEY